MRPKLRAVVVAGLGALLVAPAALAGAGLSPRSPKSPNAEGIKDAWWMVFGVAAFVFVVVEATLIVFLVRYRRQRRAYDAEGPQIRGNRRLEIAWTVVPVLLLAAIAGVVFALVPQIEDAPKAAPGSSQAIRVEGHQFYWLFRYPGGAISIDTMVVPVDQVVNLEVVADDVIHSWWIPELGGKIDAIPGRTNSTWFKAQQEGTFKGRCAEFCGLQHALMLAWVRAVKRGEYEKFLGQHQPSSPAVGKETFEGVCAKCHGVQGQGTGYAPRIAGREFDQATVDVIRHGGVKMPAVGATWSDAQVNATVRYLNETIGTGASSGG